MDNNYLNTGKAIEDLAHLVKNILQVMSSCLDVMDIALQKKQYDKLEQSFLLEKACFWRLKKFLLDLIYYTKNYPPQISKINIAQILNQAKKSVEPILAPLPVDLPTSQSAECDALADPELLKVCLTQILVFLSDHFGKDKIKIEIKTCPCDHKVKLLFSYAGPPLPADQWKQWDTPVEEKGLTWCTGFELPVARKLLCQQSGALLTPPESHDLNTLAVLLPSAS